VLQLALSFEMKDAVDFARIYSTHGLEKSIKEAEHNIKVKQTELSEVEKGERWNPLMKNFNKKELSADIEKLQVNIQMYKAAIQIKEIKSQGDDPHEIVIDGMIYHFKG
jgi:hypothetical protein